MRSYKINGKQKYSLWEAIKLMENKNIHYEKLYNININWKYLVVKLVDSPYKTNKKIRDYTIEKLY